MDFSLDETQRILQAEARKFADAQLRPGAAARDRTHEFPLKELRALAELGFMGVNISGDYGGAEAGVVAYSVAVTELARGDAAVTVTTCVNNMVGEVIERFGTPEQREAHIPKLTSGEYSSGSFCLSEPGSGSDAAGMQTRAVKTDDGWVLNGAKSWITSGSHAGVYIVWAKTEVAGKDRISAFLVDPKAPGVSVGRAEEKMGQRGSDTVSLAFEDVALGEDALLGELGQGFPIAMVALDGGRIGVGSLALGLAEEALAQALAYTVEREQFGQRIADFQNTQFVLADLATQIDAARLLVHRAAWLKETKAAKFSREASMAKLYASELASKVCDAAIQLHGGYGYTEEYPVERLWRDARVTRIYEGTSEIQRVVIARDLLRGL